MAVDGLSGIIAEGDQLNSLIALRDRLASEVDHTHRCAVCGAASARDVAMLTKQLVEVLERIALIEPPKESKVDELARKRARRRAASVRRSTAEDSVEPASAD